MAASGAEFSYYPFETNWHDDANWRCEMLRSPRLVRAGLTGYQRVLTDKTIFSQSWAGHQLVVDYRHRWQRWRLLETGLVLRRLPEIRDYGTRLLSAESYAQACAELRAALLLMRMGFRVQRDPANRSTRPQSRRSGPDWLALHLKGAFGVEVKCPNISDLMRGRAAFVTRVSLSAAQILGGGQAVSMTLDERAIADGVIGPWANKVRADQLTLDALAEAEATGSALTTLGKVTPAPLGFSSMIGPVTSDEEHEAARLRDLLQEGADQLRGWSPGIVIIDSSVDFDIMRRCCAVSELLQEPWASELALVMLVADTFPGFVTTIVKGRRYDEFAAARIRGPRLCSKGHFHVDTFGPVERACSLDDLFQNYPPFCAAASPSAG